MRADIHRGQAALEALFPQWENLAARAAQPQPFFMPEWVRAWRAQMDVNREPVVLTVSEGEELCALLPFVEISAAMGVGLWPMSFHTGDDFAPLYRGEVEAFAPALAQGMGELLARQVFIWLPLVSEDCWGPLAEALEGQGLLRGSCIKKTDTQLLVEMAALDPEALDPSGKAAKNRRYELRQMEKIGEVRFACIESEEAVREFLPRWRWLERQSWKHEAKQGLLYLKGAREMYGELLPALAAKGRACIDVLYVGEDVAACQLGLLSEGYYGLHNTVYHRAYAEYSPGTHLLYHSLREARERGVRCYDFMQGTQDYKRKLATHSKRLADVTLYTRGWKGWSHRALRSVLGSARVKATQ